MKTAKFVALLLICITLLSGCEPILSYRLYNYTGASIVVFGQNQNTTLENGMSQKVMFVKQSTDGGIQGILIRMGSKQRFFPLLKMTGMYDMNTTPGGYYEKVGINTVQVNLAVDKTGDLYILKPATKLVPPDVLSQPIGFPMHPQ